MRLLLALAVLALGISAQAATYNIDPTHSSADFSITHLAISKVKGGFNNAVNGTINFDEKNLAASSADVTIDVKAISTGVDKRDEHLKSPDFFDTAKFPTMTFKTTKVSGTTKKMKITGDLSLHGVTKSVTLDGEFNGAAKDPWGNQRAGFTASGKINRNDFGVTGGKAGAMVGSEANIDLNVEGVIKADADKAAAPK